MAAQAPPNFRGRRAVFVEDHQSFGEFIRSDQVRDPTEEVAKDIAALAKEYSPRGKGWTGDGHMADKFKVNRNAGYLTVGKKHPNSRVMVTVTNDDRASVPNEFGNKITKRHRMLGRAGAAFGDFRPKDGPK